jgi:molybdopterin-containing oxidoreductase family iron-sulfur binding subunit
MAYNRCVGTRYCANNCPYKVRRFNWFLYNKNSEFDYHMNDDLGRMVLNPDVNVRSRGVMEKCSMCIQMTQATILMLKEGREVIEGEFQTACSNACSTGAMTLVISMLKKVRLLS